VRREAEEDCDKNDIGQNVVRLAVASPAEIVKHIAQPQFAWIWYDFDSNYFGLGTNGWMDYPDLSVGDNFFYFATRRPGSEAPP
jgi:hypothetical protein